MKKLHANESLSCFGALYLQDLHNLYLRYNEKDIECMPDTKIWWLKQAFLLKSEKNIYHISWLYKKQN